MQYVIKLWFSYGYKHQLLTYYILNLTQIIFLKIIKYDWITNLLEILILRISDTPKLGLIRTFNKAFL